MTSHESPSSEVAETTSKRGLDIKDTINSKIHGSSIIDFLEPWDARTRNGKAASSERPAAG